MKFNTKVVLFGTYDQTHFLLNNIKNFNKLNIVGFVPYENFNDEPNNKKRLKFNFPELSVNSKLLKSKNYQILISSYEYVYDIEREIKENFKKIKYFKYYTGYSRDMRDYSELKKDHIK